MQSMGEAFYIHCRMVHSQREYISLLTFRYPEKPINMRFVYDSVAYVLYAVDCPHIPRATHYFNQKLIIYYLLIINQIYTL